MQLQTLPEWLQYIEQQHGQAIELGLERITGVAGRLGLSSKPQATVVTVAGTNGKGSFVASLAALLAAHGRRVGCYTSPHILRFNERITINGREVDDESLVQAFERVEKARQGEKLTYFEFTTLAAFRVFEQAQPDVIILEVGLGGRLDAVNIIEPDIAVITTIDLDHQDYLGNTRSEIAAEKAGILRKTTPLFCTEKDLPELLPNVDNGRELYIKGRDFTVTHKQQGWSLASDKLPVQTEILPDTGLSPDSQSAAWLVAERLLDNLDPGLGRDTLKALTLPGRFQRFVTAEGVTIIVDVAHNEQAAGLLHYRLQQMPVAGKRLAVMHLLSDKDADGIIAALQADIDGWFVGALDHPRATDSQALADAISRHSHAPVSISKNMRQAFARALSLCKAGDQIIIFGSFLVAAELLPGLDRL